jgi:hypothetical protein
VYDQTDTDAVHPQFDRIVEFLREELLAMATYLEDAREDILAFTIFPKARPSLPLSHPPRTMT